MLFITTGENLYLNKSIEKMIMYDRNPLLNLIVSTAVGPGHVMTNYLDEASKAGFF